MSFLRAGGDGVYNIPALNASGQLYIRGKKFEDYINELVFEDSFEQAEITELKLLLQYLNTTGLSSEWIIDNNNKNQDLKTLITALQTKLANIDTTALTLPSDFTNDNRNSVLKAAIDSVDGKTRYVSSVQGSNTEPKVASDFQVSIADCDKRRIYMTTGANFISSINDSTNQATAHTANYADNNIYIAAQNGMITSLGHLNRIQSIDTIELTGFGGMGIQSSPNIKIGNKGAQILIGSEDTPELNSTNTVIKIGKRDLTKNTETQLRGNIKLVDARFDELATSPALTWTFFLGLISTSGMPLWVASAILTSLVPNYVYSDLWAMKGTLTKDGDVETTLTPKMKGFSVFDSSVTGIDILPKVTVFLAKGDVSTTTLLGSIRQQVFDGEIVLRNNNILSTNIDWALTNSGDKNNYIKISNNDMEVALAGGAANAQMRIGNYATNGKIRFRMGSAGLQANAHDALAIYNDQASSQVLIAGSNVPSGYDTSSKLLVDHQSMTHGIKVTKASEALITRVNHNNINTPSLTLQSNWTGTTANSLYLNASNQLMYNGSAVGSGAGGGGTGAGAIFILNNPSNLTNAFLGTTMTTTFTSVSATFIRREAFVANTVYGMGQFKSPYIDYSSNVILQGTYEANLYGLLLSYQVSSIFCKLYHVAERAVITDYLVDKTALYSTNNNTGLYFSMKSKVFVLPANECNFTINSVVINQLTVAAGMGGGEPLTLRLSLKNDLGSTIGNAVDINFGGGPTITQDYTFNFNQILNISGTTIVAFQIDIIDSMFGMAQIRQITSRAQNDINYKFQGVFKNCLYNGTNDKTTLAYNQMQLYSILLPLPSNSYDTSEFTVYSKLQLEPFFIQTGTGSTSGNSFSLYCGDNTLSHFHTSINLGGGAGSIPTLAQVMNNDLVALGAPYLVNATRATQHLDMNAKTIYNATIDGYNIKSLIAGNNITLTGGSGTFTINTASVYRGFRYYNGGNRVHKVTFNLGNAIDLRTNQVRGTFKMRVQNNRVDNETTMIFPFMHFNQLHIYPTQGGDPTDHTWVNHSWNGNSGGPMVNALAVPPKTQFGQNPCFAQVEAVICDTTTDVPWIVTNFTINLLHDSSTGVSRGITCDGNWHYSTKRYGTTAYQFQQGTYSRLNDLGGSNFLTHLVFGSFVPYNKIGSGVPRGVEYADLVVEVVPIPTYTTQTT